MRSPRNIASRRSARPDCSAQLEQQRKRLVVDPVLGVVEVEPGALGRQPRPPLRVLGEQVAQVERLDLGVIALQLPPRRALAQRWDLLVGHR